MGESGSEKKYIRFKELMSTFNHADVSFIKSLFEAHFIRHHIQGEAFMLMRPLAQPVGIMVDEEQFDEAKKLLEDFTGRFSGIAKREEDNK